MTPVEQIKERLSITDVVSTYIRLEKAGGQYKARCPFHNEKTPSFFVSPTRGSFYCFGCNVGGDIFTFVEKIENLDFKEALKILADRSGVELTAFRKTDESPLLEIIEAATVFFEDSLGKNLGASAYLKERGLIQETISDFRIGYAPNEWRALRTHLEKLGYGETLLKRSGLFIEHEKGVYDRFRARIMFPISNSSGRIIGFSGRILPAHEREHQALGKYINSPESEIYHKSRVLFGYDKAKRAMQEENLAIVVEGQMDLCLAHQSGTKNAVAVSGTALSSEHLALIKRFAGKVAFCLDNDAAGFAALKRSAALALSANLETLVISLSEKDPAETIRENPEVWHKAISQADHIVGFLLKKFKKDSKSERDYKTLVHENVVPILSLISNAIDQAHFVHEVAETLLVPEDAVRVEMKKVRVTTPKEEVFKLPDKKRADRILEKIMGLHYLEHGPKSSPPKDVISILGADKKGTILGAEIPEDVAKKLVFEAEMSVGESGATKEMETLKLFLEEEILKERYEKFSRELKRKEREGINTEKELTECHQLSKRLQEVKDKLRGVSFTV